MSEQPLGVDAIGLAGEKGGERPESVAEAATQGSSLLSAAYTEVGANYRSIDDLRLKLLGLLPLATGTGIILLLGKDGPSAATAVPAGVFGMFATVSLGIFELHGVEKCAHFIHRGEHLERIGKVPASFTGRPEDIFGVKSELLPARILYPASLAGWVYITAYVAASLKTDAGHSAAIAGALSLLTFVAGFFAVGRAIRYLDDRREKLWSAERAAFASNRWPTVGQMVQPTYRLILGWFRRGADRRGAQG